MYYQISQESALRACPELFVDNIDDDENSSCQQEEVLTDDLNFLITEGKETVSEITEVAREEVLIKEEGMWTSYHILTHEVAILVTGTNLKRSRESDELITVVKEQKQICIDNCDKNSNVKGE